MALFILVIGLFSTVVPLEAQTPFPLPNWFRNNISRPPVDERSKAYADYLKSLSKEGKLSLTEADTVRLVLENNLDVVVDRYDPALAFYDIDRAYTLLDPKLRFTLSAGRSAEPLPNTVIAGVNSLRTLNYQANFSYTQLFQTGTQFEVDFNNLRQSNNGRFNVINPYIQSNVLVSVTQPLLRNFGRLPNTRLIRINRNNRNISENLFAQRVIDLVNQTQNLYWDLVFGREDIKVKQRSLDLATKVNEDTRRQIEIGTMAPIELVKTQTEIANRKEDLIVAQFNLQQMEDQMKKLISSVGDPAQIVSKIDPTDSTLSPSALKDFDLVQAISYAVEARPEIKQARKQIENGEIDVQYFRNQMLPRVDLTGSYGPAGLGGDSKAFLPDGTVVPGPSSSYGDVLRQMFQGQFNTYLGQLSVEIPIKNRAAQADYARASIAKRQTERFLKALEQQIALEVRNAHTALEMDRARIEATQRARELQEKTLDAEQKKFKLGTSTIRFVLEEQRNLAVAQSAELQALVDFTKAKNNLEKAMGKTLEANNIKVEDALTARATAPDKTAGSSAATAPDKGAGSSSGPTN
jgi:outer membrane protein TolC